MATLPASSAGTTGSIRQSSRQTRTNPSRTSKTTGRPSALGLTSQTAAEPSNAPSQPQGIYPAITQFTDAITALPREFRRHSSLLKEVDAKAFSLEDVLSRQLDAASSSTPNYYNTLGITPPGNNGSNLQPEDPGYYETPESLARRKNFADLRQTLSEFMISADEKNHVLWNANQELRKHIYRLDQIYPYVKGEVSDEARLGSLTHWAYTDKSTEKPAASERPRREAASTHHHHAHADGDRAPGVRKPRRNPRDVDIDDGRRKTSGKVPLSGPGANQPAPTKRRRVEKTVPAAQGAGMERSVSATTNTAGAGRGGSKDTLAPDGAVKKRTRAPNAATSGRKRTNTITSTAGSPSLISSPVAPSLSLATKAASPIPTSQRPPSSRAQPTPVQAMNGRQRPSSAASNRMANSSTFPGPGPIPNQEVSNYPVPLADKSILDPKATSTRDSASSRVDLASITTGANGEDITTLSTSRMAEAAPEREDITGGSANKADSEYSFPAPSKGRSSKNSTPVISTFAEAQRTRPSRNTDGPSKRSHKKNASLAAAQQLAAAAAATEDEDSSRQLDDEDDESEPRYCYCNQVSYGDMVACDMDTCPREWFHLSCVGLTKPPLKSAKWYCNECKETLRKGRSGNGRS